MQGFKDRFRPRFGHRLRLRFGRESTPDEKQTTLARMRTGHSGRVVEIAGGQRMISRLSALGIRPGQRITKVSSMFMRGPVTIQLSKAQVAIGHGMATRIIVKPD